MHLEHEIDVARRAAGLAAETALRYFRSGIGADTKTDGSPVTEADRECERAVAGLIEETFPEDGVLGEEGASKPSRGGRRWIIDPIDGTRDFLRGNRFWATLIGLEIDGDVAVGVAGFPALGETYWAARGAGAFQDGRRLHVSSVGGLSEAVLCVNGLNNLHTMAFGERLPEWMRRFWAVRSLGGAPDAVLVAAGRAEVWIEPAAKCWDLAPLKILAEEAGGRFWNFDGGSSIHGGNCVISTPALEAEVGRFLAG